MSMILFAITVPMAITSTHFSTLCIRLRYRRKYMFLEPFIDFETPENTGLTSQTALALR